MATYINHKSETVTKMMSWIKDQSGVSMVELMVVLVVLTIGILPIAAVQTRSHRDVFDSGNRTEALNIAHLQMERAKGMGFNNAVTDSGWVNAVYRWDTVVANQGFGLNSVAVTVQWQERGRNQSITINNLLSLR